MRSKKLIPLIFLANSVMAIVPTIDQHELANDIGTMAGYGATLGGYLSRISQATTVANQLQHLQSLQQLETAGTGLCALCTASDGQQLQTYINNVNDDLCSQFSWAMQNITGVAQNINNIDDIINEFQINPKAALLALQRSSIQTAASTQNTIAQIQVLLSQQGQKELAEQKLEKQNSDAAYTGFNHSGL